ncbi:unnamed protein product [Amaranthus hypochondriacus]
MAFFPVGRSCCCSFLIPKLLLFPAPIRLLLLLLDYICSCAFFYSSKMNANEANEANGFEFDNISNTAFEELQMIEQQRQDELLRSQQTSASTPRNVNPNSMFRFGESVVPQAKQQYVRDFCARCRVLCFVLEKVFHGGHTHVHLMDDTFVVDI